MIISEEEMPLVSVSCFTFNHEKYIKDTLEGFLIQKTSFPFEVLIHDDASTDRTQKIIREYEGHYPHIFKVIYQKENQFSKVGGWDKTIREHRKRARGKYYAICEGDDYWTDELKLQTQYEFMEMHPEYSACFHSTIELNGLKQKEYYPVIKKKSYYIKDVIRFGGGLIPTNSFFCKTQFFQELADWEVKCPVGDIRLNLFFALKGEIGYIDKPMSVYRVLSDNSWSHRIRNNKKYRKEHNKGMIRMWVAFNKYTKYRYNWLVMYKIIRKLVADAKNNLIYSFDCFRKN